MNKIAATIIYVLSAYTSGATPVIDSFSASPTTLDVSSQANLLIADFEITDPEGIQEVSVSVVGPEGAALRFTISNFQDPMFPDLPILADFRVSGTVNDGRYRIGIPILRGTVAGTYRIELDVTGLSGETVNAPNGVTSNIENDSDLSYTIDKGAVTVFSGADDPSLFPTLSGVVLDGSIPGAELSARVNFDREFAGARVVFQREFASNQIETVGVYLEAQDVVSNDDGVGSIDFTIPASLFGASGTYNAIVAYRSPRSPDLFDEFVFPSISTGDGFPGPKIEVVNIASFTEPLADVYSISLVGPTPTEDFEADITSGPAIVPVQIFIEGSSPPAKIEVTGVLRRDRAGDPALKLFAKEFLFERSDENGRHVFGGLVEIPMLLPSGNYRLGFEVRSEGEIYARFEDSRAPFLDVINSGDVDSTPPEIIAVTLDSTEIDITGRRGEVTGTVSIVDDLSGLDLVALSNSSRLMLPGTREATIPVTIDVSGQSSGSFSFVADIPAGTKPGRWFLDFRASDQVGQIAVTEFNSAPLTPNETFSIDIVDQGTGAFAAFLTNNPSIPSDSRALNSDPDHDGFPNGLECLFGTDPMAASIDQAVGEQLPIQLFLRDEGDRIDLDFLVDRASAFAGTNDPLEFFGVITTDFVSQIELVPVSLGGHRYRISLPVGDTKSFLQLGAR